MAGTGASVFLGELDDFLAPSQACVNPLFVSNDGGAKGGKGEGAGERKDDRRDGPIVLEMEEDGALLSQEEALPPLPPSQQPQGRKPNLIGQDSTRKTAVVSLTDCLACSGCVTTAEAVLVAQQSHEKFMQQVSRVDDAVTDGTGGGGEEPAPFFQLRVVSLSPQTVAAIAAEYGAASTAEAMGKLRTFLKRHCHIDYVLDVTVAGDLALLEAKDEFVRRFRNRRPIPWRVPCEGDNGDADEAAAATAAADCGSGIDGEKRMVVEGATNDDSAGAVPMLTSACPGWVCYAEKTQPEAIPYISRTRSPQQIMGAILKTVVAEDLGIAPLRVFHATIMPCFDKKLEASRGDFEREVTGGAVPDVDHVLATTELQALLRQAAESDAATAATSAATREGGNAVGTLDVETIGEAAGETAQVDVGAFFNALPVDLAPLDGSHSSGGHAWLNVLAFSRVHVSADDSADALALSLSGAAPSRGGAGGYLDYVFRRAAQELFGVDVGSGPLEFARVRNADFNEVTLEVDGATVLRFAQAYGFRNIQSIVNQLKRGDCAYHFVEIMACPSGCLNGGGQTRPERELPSAGRKRVAHVGEVFHTRHVSPPEENTALLQLVSSLPRHSRPDIFTTQYHVIPKLESVMPQAIPW